MTSTLKVSAFLLLTLCACGTARLGKTDSFGGRVLLQGSYMPAMAEARFLMGDHCGSRFQTVEQGNLVEFRCTGSDDLTAATAVAEVGTTRTTVAQRAKY